MDTKTRTAIEILELERKSGKFLQIHPAQSRICRGLIVLSIMEGKI